MLLRMSTQLQLVRREVMTDQKQGEISAEVEQKVAPEVEVKNPAREDCENPEDPISEESEVPKTGDAPAD